MCKITANSLKLALYMFQPIIFFAQQYGCPLTLKINFKVPFKIGVNRKKKFETFAVWLPCDRLDGKMSIHDIDSVELHLSYFHLICKLNNHLVIEKALQCSESDRNLKINGVVSDDDAYDPAIVGFFALHYAAQNGNVNTVKLLFQYAADITAMAQIGSPILVSISLIRQKCLICCCNMELILTFFLVINQMSFSQYLNTLMMRMYFLLDE